MFRTKLVLVMAREPLPSIGLIRLALSLLLAAHCNPPLPPQYKSYTSLTTFKLHCFDVGFVCWKILSLVELP